MGPVRDPGQEPEGERDQHPSLADDEEEHGLEHDAGGHQPGRGLVDGIGEAEQLAHVRHAIADKSDHHSRDWTGVGTTPVRRRPDTVGAVTIRLTVRTAMWRSHVASVASAVDGLVPVVKGNGYGFGRVELARIAAEFADVVAVGTVHELAGLPGELEVVVLTPDPRSPRRRRRRS